MIVDGWEKRKQAAKSSQDETNYQCLPDGQSAVCGYLSVGSEQNEDVHNSCPYSPGSAIHRHQTHSYIDPSIRRHPSSAQDSSHHHCCLLCMLVAIGEGLGGENRSYFAVTYNPIPNECGPLSTHVSLCTHVHTHARTREHPRMLVDMHALSVLHIYPPKRLHTCMQTHMQTHRRVCTHARMQAHRRTCRHTPQIVCAHMCAHFCARTRTRAHTDKHARTCAHAHTCTRAHTQTHARVCAHARTQTHTQIHTHMHTYCEGHARKHSDPDAHERVDDAYGAKISARNHQCMLTHICIWHVRVLVAAHPFAT